MPGETVAIIRIDMIQQDTRHPNKRRRHQGRASCDVVGRCFEAKGPAPIYKLATLLWLHGHVGEHFEVWDDLSPFGNPGGLAMSKLTLSASEGAMIFAIRFSFPLDAHPGVRVEGAAPSTAKWIDLRHIDGRGLIQTHRGGARRVGSVG